MVSLLSVTVSLLKDAHNPRKRTAASGFRSVRAGRVPPSITWGGRITANRTDMGAESFYEYGRLAQL